MEKESAIPLLAEASPVGHALSEPSVFVKILFVMTREEAASSGSPLGPRPISDSNTDSRLNKTNIQAIFYSEEDGQGKGPRDNCACTKY